MRIGNTDLCIIGPRTSTGGYGAPLAMFTYFKNKDDEGLDLLSPRKQA